MPKKSKDARDIQDLIPISISVRMLEDKYIHLRNIVWNSKDEEVEPENKNKDTN